MQDGGGTRLTANVLGTIRELIPIRIRQLLGGWVWRARNWGRRKLLLRRLRGNAVECNVCGWHGAGFTDDVWHQGTICPVCRSDVRHRLLMAVWLRNPQWNAEKVLKGRKVLHFAPERILRGYVQGRALVYEAADFLRRDVDWRVDMSDMPSIPDAAFDTLIACDVLEHVPDDRAALRECHRILKAGGIAILTAPQMDPPSTTDEQPGVASEAERLERFGQKDHVRIYGDDLPSRIESAGFNVTMISAGDFTENDVARFVLKPPVKNPHPLATNQRRLYFCRKAG